MNVMRWTARAGAAGVAALVLVSLTVGPAEAAVSRSYAKGAVVELVEMGPMPGAPGNAHYGHLEFYSSTTGDERVLGYIFHLQCPDGFTLTTTDVFLDAANELESNCQFFTDGTESLETGDLTIRMTKDQTWTHVAGYFDSSLPTQPQVEFSLDLRGEGAVTETNSVSRGPGYKQLTRLLVRGATVKGHIGGLGLADEADDLRFVGQVMKTRVKTYTW